MSSNTKVYEDKMKSSVEHLSRELAAVRAGRAPWFSDVSGVSFSGAFLFVRSRVYSITGVRSLTYSN